MLIMMWISCWLLTAWIIRRSGILSPAAISATFTSTSLTPFFYSYCTNTDYEIMMQKNMSYKNIWSYENIMFDIVGAHLLLVMVTLISIIGIEQPKRDFSRTGMRLRKTLTRIMPVRAEVAAPTSYLACYGLLWLIVLLFAHFLSIDKNLLWQNDDYMLLNYADQIGLRIKILDMLHQVMGPISVLTLCLSYYFWQKRQTLPLILAVTAFSYASLIKLAMFSRWSALTALIFTGLLAARRIARGKSILGFVPVLMSLVTLRLFLYAITARGGEVQGIAGIIPNLFNFDYAARDISHLILNICMGPYVMAEAIHDGRCVYDPTYVNLSFSPLPSFIDGWRSVLDLQHRVNWYTPFNCFSELYFFGWPYQLFYAIVYAICVRVLTKVVSRMNSTLSILVTAPALYSFFSFHEYPVRMSFRILIYSALLAWVVSRVSTLHLKRRSTSIEVPDLRLEDETVDHFEPPPRSNVDRRSGIGSEMPLGQRY